MVGRPLSGTPRLRGFTLVELLVVIAIIAILIGLLLPAVQKVREAAARSTCLNNMKQIGIALHAYHDASNSLPPHSINGVNGVGNIGRGFGPGWAVLILPYMEQGPLYAQYGTSIQRHLSRLRDGTTDTTDEVRWTRIGENNIKTYICPSDAFRNVPYDFTIYANGQNWDSTVNAYYLAQPKWARGNYGANNGVNYGPWDQTAGGNEPNTSYDGVTGGGVITIQWGAKLGVLSGGDGTSNTIMVNEIRSSPEPNDVRGTWALTLFAANNTAGAPENYGGVQGPNSPVPSSSRTDLCVDRADIGLPCYDDWGGEDATNTPRSLHTGGVNTLFADGSTRFITNNIATMNWLAMLSRSDGMSVSAE